MYRLRGCRIFSSFLQLQRRSTQFTRSRGLAAQSEESVAKSQEEGPKSWRQNPNLKYWVIGVSAVTGIIYRYVYKEKEKSKLVIKNYPPLPNHKLQPRLTEIEELAKLHNSLRRNGTVVLHLEGPSGAGKSQIARSFAEKLVQEEEARYHVLPHNLFIGTVNAISLETMLFDLKKFAIAIGCQAKEWLDKAGDQYANLSSEQQLGVIVAAVKEKLAANPNWVLIMEDMHNKALFDKLFADEDGSDWGKGTIIVTQTGLSSRVNTFVDNVYHLDKGMNKNDAVQLLQNLCDLPADKTTGTEEVINKLKHSPLAVVCAGSYINSKTQRSPDYSIELFSQELNTAYKTVKENNSKDISENSQIFTHIVAALFAKEVIHASPHFLHTFDLVGTCSPEWPIPVTLISLHLRSPGYGLPEVPRSGPVLPVKSPDQDVVETHPKPEEDVQEMFLSIKRLAHNLESFTTAVKENYKAVKEMFNPPPVDMAPQADGVLDLMRTCPLLTITRVDPGGTQTVKVSPIVHSVVSQLFNCITAPLMEEQHLIQAEDKHNKSSFFRRLWQFDPQRTLQEYRNGFNEDSSRAQQDQQNEVVLPMALDIDVSSLFKNHGDDIDLPDFRAIQPTVAADHYRQHTSRILETISRTASVCSQDVQTRTLARLLKPHLDHILTMSTSESLGNTSRAHALSAVASINSATGNLEASISSLERALEIEVQHFGDSSLEAAATLTRLADVHSSLDDAQKARELLERAYSIYDTHRKKSGEYKNPLEFARTMEALGAVYGTLGYKQQSKEYIERAFSYMQSAVPTSPDEIEGRRFACEVASTLTDLGHAYLSLGDAFQGRKLLDLAVTGLKNMYGEEHPEVVRALTVLSTAYTMQGNWQEGRKIRKEAGKLQAKLDITVPL